MKMGENYIPLVEFAKREGLYYEHVSSISPFGGMIIEEEYDIFVDLKENGKFYFCANEYNLITYAKTAAIIERESGRRTIASFDDIYIVERNMIDKDISIENLMKIIDGERV